MAKRKKSRVGAKSKKPAPRKAAKSQRGHEAESRRARCGNRRPKANGFMRLAAAKPTASPTCGNLLGGKGAGLAEMASLGLPVPPGSPSPPTSALLLRQQAAVSEGTARPSR